MGAVLLERPKQVWVCPLCGGRDQTDMPGPGEAHTRMHACPALGLTAPMLPEGVRCHARVVEREDYVGGELVQLDTRSRPVMSVIVERDDGCDTTVYAPLATVHVEQLP